VQNKLDLLKKCSAPVSGWSMRVSPPSMGMVSKLTKSHYRDVFKARWESCIREVLGGCAPSAVLIVGKGVDFAIGDLVCARI
jgi:hypothetical protein